MTNPASKRFKMIETINPHVMKILITIKEGDSIRAISKRINLSYGWTHHWVKELIRLKVIKQKGQKVKVNKRNKIYKGFMSFIKKIIEENLELSDAYEFPNLSGLEYAFTSIDSVFIWTKGGYNIGRSKASYPIFTEVLEKDLSKWKKFFDKFSIKYSENMAKKKDIYFILKPKKTIKKEKLDGFWVIPLKDTVDFAKEYIYNFEPALEMLDDMYSLDLGVVYA